MTERRFADALGGNPPQNYERFFVPAIGAPLATDLSLFLLHRFPNLEFHLRGHLGGASGKFGRAPFAIARYIVNEQFHLAYLADLRLNNFVCQLTNT